MARVRKCRGWHNSRFTVALSLLGDRQPCEKRLVGHRVEGLALGSAVAGIHLLSPSGPDEFFVDFATQRKPSTPHFASTSASDGAVPVTV
jgi:hypothetical protein